MEDKRKEKIIDEVFVEGNGSNIPDLLVGKFLVTQEEYKMVTGNNPSRFTGNDKNPVERTNWFDAVKFCNALSEREGLKPCYVIDGEDVYINPDTGGYYLPFSDEWTWFASGGKKSKGYIYAGSNNIDEVAWWTENSNGKVHPVGLKKPNEIGLYDCSGLLWEWSSSSEMDE